MGSPDGPAIRRTSNCGLSHLRTIAPRRAEGNSLTVGRPLRRVRAATGRRDGWWLPLGVVVLSYALAFAQRPGRAYSDSRAELTIDPGLFLDRVSHVWSNTTDLGHVQSGQFIGYLSPMAPWFAAGDALGIPLWIVQRLWLGTLFALAAWGVVKLMDALYDRHRGAAHAIAALLYGTSPFLVVYTSRGTSTLLSYCALPWLMLAVHRGLAAPRRWRWPVVAGLAFALAGGGTNAAIVAWILPGPAALALYEVWLRRRTRRDVVAFGWRASACVIVGSLWWVVPVAVQARYGSQFLSFTEQPDAIWETTSMSESLRVMGNWVTYFGSGFGAAQPTTEVGATYLFNPAVVLATFLVPLAAFGGMRWTRRWVYAPFLALLAVGTLLVITVGFPEGKPLARVATEAYYDVASLQFLRTSVKAAPMLALAIACLSGACAAWLVARARAGDLRTPALGGVRARRLPAWALLPLLAVPLAWGLPLFTARAVDDELAFGSVPDSWHQAMRDADRATPRGQRIMVLPGQLFGYYRWGRTLDPVAPAVSDRPVLARAITRYADVRSSQLQTAVDDLIQQQRLVPLQLHPLLRLMGVGQVVVATDGKREQSGELDPAQLATTLAGQQGYDLTRARYGPTRTFAPEPGRGGPLVSLPELRRYGGPSGTEGIVRVHPRRRPTLIDGDAEGIVEAAAHPGAVDLQRALFYAGDLDPQELRDQTREGARIVFTDSNRRQILGASRITENRGPTLGASDPLPRELPSYDLFAHGSDDQTVAINPGLAYLRSPTSQQFAIFPEQRPFAAFDGRLDRPWIASAQSMSRRWIELALANPQPVQAIRVHPHDDDLGRTEALGVSENGGPERTVDLRPGWNTVPIRAGRLEKLRLRVARIEKTIYTGRGGLDEVQIPGVTIDERLRLPVRTANVLRGSDLRKSQVDVLLRRTTADVPYRAGADLRDAQADNRISMVDAEPGLKRRVTLPVARSFRVEGWASVAPTAPDPDIDRLAGMSPRWRFASSSRFEGVPAQRASSAFDGSTLSSWVGDWAPGRPAWIAFSGPRRITLRRFRIRGDGRGIFALPASVRVTTDAGRTRALRVQTDGTVLLPAAVRTRRLRIDVATVLSPTGLNGARLLGGVAISELQVPGLDPPRPRGRGNFGTPCGSLTFRAGAAGAKGRVRGTIADLDRGGALRFEGCGRERELTLSAGPNDLDAPAGPVMRPDHVLLASKPPDPFGSIAAPRRSRVLDAGRFDSVSPVPGQARLSVREPAWLVLAESYAPAWRAWCRDGNGDETALGAPEPIDGYANGWRVGPDCRSARFEFTPQSWATASYLVSGLALLIALAVLFVGFVIRRRDGETVDPAAFAASDATTDPVRRLAWRRAVPLAVAMGAVGGFVFAWRAGAVLAVALLVLARWGLTARRLLALTAAAFAVVPVLYLIDPAPDVGGYFFEYAYWHEEAHWVAVAGVCALALAAGLDAAASRRRVS